MKVAVVFGGSSLEAEVSRASAEAVSGALTSRGHEVSRFALDGALPELLQREKPDVVFPVAHGTFGEDGCLQGLLEILALPYVGSGVLASATAADKAATKRVYLSAGLPVARDLLLGRGQGRELDDIRALLGSDFIVKPVSGGSSFGVSKITPQTSESEFLAAIEAATQHGPALVEEFLPGKELTCGVLEVDGNPLALPPTRVVAQAGQFYDYRSKYAQGGSRHETPADLPAAVTELVQDLSVRAHAALGARDLSRTDFIVSEEGKPTLLETNTLPGMTGVSLFPEAALAAGLPFPELLDRLVRSAVRRATGGPPRAAGVALPAPFA